MNDELPEAHFGEVGGAPAAWRQAPDLDPDDEPGPTPRDVTMMLGFDPAAEKA